jgi:hypothetical protein
VLLTSQQLQRKTLPLFLALLCCACLISIPLKSANASEMIPHKAATVMTTGDVFKCVPSNEAVNQNCYAPTVDTNPSCTGTQYWTTRDSSNVPINWTYTNGNSWCVAVHYNTLNDSRTCAYQFYVPNGYATATFVIGYVENGVHHISAPINEANITGWHTFLSGVRNVTSFDFSDNNGQAIGSQLIGFGTDSHYSLSSSCA